MTHVSPYAIVDAPNYGEPCPCGHDLPGSVPVHTALKIPPLTVSEHCNCETFAVICTLNLPASVVAHNGHATTTSMQRFSQRAATVETRTSSPRLHPKNLLDLHTGTSNKLSMNCNWESLRSANPDHGKQPLRHDRDVDDLSLHTTSV